MFSPASLPYLSLILACAFAMSAHAVVQVRAASQLSREKAVSAMVQPYQALSATNVVMERCAKEYGITESYRAYQADLFGRVSKQYMDAYSDAYVKYVGYPPDAIIVEDYTKIIRNQQEDAVKNTAAVIDQRGCYDASIRSLMKYLEKLRNATSQPRSQ